MSTLHAMGSTCNPAEMARVRSPLEAFNTLRNAATVFAVHLSASIQHRGTMRTLDRFCDRRLHDLGFERDWNGTIIRIVDGQ
ncbi:hypothetical protein [Mesorhizobium sp. WSM2239]|uniref:DUF1127 domain-containing protein n=2 Tax=unclassified Mesorhizobium TaxID=325217 RepID=A0AAU8DGQ7_9HYPH